MRLLSPGLLFLLFLEFGCGKKSPTAPELQNQPPVIKTYTPSTSQVQLVPGQSQKFEVEATDSDGDSLQYRWLLSGREVATTELPYNLNNNGRDYNLGTITTVDATDFKFDDITNLLRGQNGFIYLFEQRTPPVIYVNLTGEQVGGGGFRYDHTERIRTVVQRLDAELGEHFRLPKPDSTNTVEIPVNSYQEEGELMGKLIEGKLYPEKTIIGMITKYLPAGANPIIKDNKNIGRDIRGFWRVTNAWESSLALPMTEIGQMYDGTAVDSDKDYWRDTIHWIEAAQELENGITSRTVYQGREMSKEKNVQNAFYGLGAGTRLTRINGKPTIIHVTKEIR